MARLNATHGFISQRRAMADHGITRLRLLKAIENGEVAVIHAGLNGRVKVRASDVIRVVTGALPAPDLKPAAEGKAA